MEISPRPTSPQMQNQISPDLSRVLFCSLFTHLIKFFFLFYETGIASFSPLLQIHRVKSKNGNFAASELSINSKTKISKQLSFIEMVIRIIFSRSKTIFIQQQLNQMRVLQGAAK